MAGYDLNTAAGQAEFERRMASIIKNEVGSYTRTALSQSLGGVQQTQNNLDNTNLSIVPIGSIIPFGGVTLPNEFLWCDGSLVRKDKYARLFDVFGPNRYGTDTADEFYLPDLRDRFPRGATTTSGNATTTNVNSHTHTLNAFNASTSLNATTANFSGTTGTNTGNESAQHSHAIGHNHNTNGASTGGPNNNFNRAVGNAGCAGTTHTHGVNGASTNTNITGASNQTGGHSHEFTSSGNVSVTTGTASTTITAGTNVSQSHLPAYVSVNYIIKF